MNTDTIQDYILKSEDNLKTASIVVEVWPEARERIVTSFTGRLTLRLKKELNGWEYCSDGGRFFVDKWPGFYISKPTWKHRAIGLQCWKNRGNKMVIGICRYTPDTKQLPLHAPLLTAVQKILPMAKSSQWWEAQETMPSPAPDWQKPEVLWRMQMDDRFMEDVAGQLLNLAKVSEYIIDRLESKK